MPPRALRYFYRAFFKPDSLDAFQGFNIGLGADGRGLGYSQVWHRGNVDYSPFAVVNEFICGEVGRFLRLPIPPFAITYHIADKKRQPLFSSLDFNFNRAILPEVIPEKCVETIPAIRAGVLAFDILIANEDRHNGNLVVDRVMKPRQMHIYDQEQALLGGAKLSGAERLENLHGRLGVTGSPITGGNQHVFLKLIKSYENLKAWIDRINALPYWFIEDVCASATNFGLKKTLAKKVSKFLIHRSQSIGGLIDAHREHFAIGDWPRQRQLYMPMN